MVSSDPSALINAVLCTVIVMALMLYRRKDSGIVHLFPFWLISTSLYTPMFPSVMCSVFIKNPTGWWLLEI